VRAAVNRPKITGMKDSKTAFHWIVNLLHEQGLPFVVVGGLAANVYGGRRPLNDIDIDVPSHSFTKLMPHVKQFITFGPARYHDREFDIQLMSLRYAEQEIDLTAAESIRLFDHQSGDWRILPTDFAASERHEVFGITVPVMRRDLLVAYKKMIQRDTDLEDIAQLGR
jgi:hypothetical protein